MSGCDLCFEKGEIIIPTQNERLTETFIHTHLERLYRRGITSFSELRKAGKKMKKYGRIECPLCSKEKKYV